MSRCHYQMSRLLDKCRCQARSLHSYITSYLKVSVISGHGLKAPNSDGDSGPGGNHLGLEALGGGGGKESGWNVGKEENLEILGKL